MQHAVGTGEIELVATNMCLMQVYDNASTFRMSLEVLKYHYRH